MRIRKILNSNKGFTLIELAIVMAIIVVLVGIVIVGMGSLSTSRVTRATSDFQSIRSAGIQWMSRNGQSNYTGITTAALAPYLTITMASGNPWGGSYTAAANATDSTKLDVSGTGLGSSATGPCADISTALGKLGWSVGSACSATGGLTMTTP